MVVPTTLSTPIATSKKRALNKVKYQYSLLRALPLNSAYFFNAA